jgi:hypothetical protein
MVGIEGEIATSARQTHLWQQAYRLQRSRD